MHEIILFYVETSWAAYSSLAGKLEIRIVQCKHGYACMQVIDIWTSTLDSILAARSCMMKARKYSHP
jgi:hypothetical protein